MAKKQKTTADNIREWISDNLRYLILGLGALIVLLIIILVIRAVTGGSSGKSTVKGQNDSSVQTAGTGENSKDSSQDGEEGENSQDGQEEKAQPGDGLTQNVPEILDLMTRYYAAWEQKDMDAMRTIQPSLSAEDEADIQNNDAIESFQNITTYSTQGLTDGSSAVYVYFEVKVAGINTLAPTLTDFYLETNDSGQLVIVDKFGTDERTAFMEQMRATPGVQALIRQVNTRLSQASSEDSDLEAYVVSLQGGSTESSDSADSSADENLLPGSAGFEEGDEVYATTDINVRGEASADSILYGMLGKDHAATILSLADGGWCKIRYTTGNTTIEGYVMTQYLAKK